MPNKLLLLPIEHVEGCKHILLLLGVNHAHVKICSSEHSEEKELAKNWKSNFRCLSDKGKSHQMSV